MAAATSPLSAPVDFTKPIDHATVKGKSAIITGGASGIGAAISRALAEAGAFVIIADLNSEAGEKFASALASEGLQASFVETNITDWNSLVAAFEHCINSSPNKTVDIVITCAGVGGGSVYHDEPFLVSQGSEGRPLPPSTATINVNLIGTSYTAILAMHYFKTTTPPQEFVKAQKQLIMVASNLAYHQIPLYALYEASKMGVRGLWKSLRMTPERTGLRTNLLAPHLVRTPMTTLLQTHMDEAGIPMTETHDCVECLMRLACDDTIRGRAIQVNPQGDWFDLCDDKEGFDGAKAFWEHDATNTRKSFEFLAPLMSG